MVIARPLQNRFRTSMAVLCLLVLSIVFCFPLLKDLYLSCRGDWDYFSFLYEIPAISLFEYRQFPLWNPYCGGGMPLIGNPQAGFLSPTFLITSLFGVVAGLKISTWLHTFLGLWGMWLLSGYMGMKGTARLVPSLIFIFSSSWSLHLAEGHIVWLPAAFLPFFFLAFLKGLEAAHWLVAAAFFESLMFFEGGTYVLAFSLLFIGVYAVCNTFETGSWRPILAFLAVNVLAAALSAPKLLPMLEVIVSHPRPTDAGSAMSWDDYLSIFIERDSKLGAGWWEFGSYFGFVVVVIYLFSLSLIKKQLSLIVASLFILLVSLGNFGGFSPWHILHQLPFFSGLQVPTRSLIVFSFTVALLVGLYLEKLQNSADRRITYFVGLVVLIIGIDLFSLSSRIIPETLKPVSVSPIAWLFRKPPVAPVYPKLYRVSPAATTRLWHSIASVHQPFSQIRIPDLQRFAHGAWSDQYLPLLQNQGVVDAYEPIPFERYARAVSDKDYKGEFYMLGKGDAALLSWSPNKFVYHVKLQEKNRLVINQNFWPGWHVSSGVLTQHEGLLAIDLSPGDYDVAVNYLPRPFLIGVCIFLAAVAGIAAFLFVLRKSRFPHPESAKRACP